MTDSQTLLEKKQATPSLVDVEIRQSTFIRTTPEEVYDAIGTSKGLDGWFTSGATVDAHPGGEIHFRWKDWVPAKLAGIDAADDMGTVLEATRPKRFVFQWHGDSPRYMTTVEIDFEPFENGTVIRLREHGYENTRPGREALLRCASGWGEALTLMKFYLEHGIRY